jgi:transmembrane sensor
MSISSDMDIHEDRSELRRQAEHWFARLRAPDVSAEERREFLRWRARPEHAAAYQATEAMWQELLALTADPRMQRWLGEASSPKATLPQRLRARAWTQAMAATVSVGFIAGLLSLALRGPAKPEAPITAYISAPGETRRLTLDDGSQLMLSADTEVDVRFSRRLRELKLVRGEALFEVFHDAARPFVVDAGSGDVTALGTRFLVRRDDADVTVTLLQGRVQVDRGGGAEPATLRAGERLHFDARHLIERRSIDADAVSAWTRGRLVFQATPLGEAVTEINRYSDTQIRIADPALAAIAISGSVRIGDGDTMAAALASLLSLDLQSRSDGELMLSRK